MIHHSLVQCTLQNRVWGWSSKEERLADKEILFTKLDKIHSDNQLSALYLGHNFLDDLSVQYSSILIPEVDTGWRRDQLAKCI